MLKKDAKSLSGSEVVAPEVNTRLPQSFEGLQLRETQEAIDIDPKLEAARQTFKELVEDKSRLEDYNAYEQVKYINQKTSQLTMAESFKPADLVTEQTRLELLELIPDLVSHITTHQEALQSLVERFELSPEEIKPYFEIGVISPKYREARLTPNTIADVAKTLGVEDDLPELLATKRKAELSEGNPLYALEIARFQDRDGGALREAHIDPLREEQLFLDSINSPWQKNMIEEATAYLEYLGLAVDADRLLGKIEEGMEKTLAENGDRLTVLDGYVRGIATLRDRYELRQDLFDAASEKLQQKVAEVYISRADSYTDRFSVQYAMIAVSNVANALQWKADDVLPILWRGVEQSPLDADTKAFLEKTTAIIKQMLDSIHPVE